MLSGIIGLSSPGQLAPGAIAYASSAGILLPAPFQRTFFVPQNGLPWEGEKSPAENSNFSFNWEDGLDGDLITSSVWAVESSDIAVCLSVIDATDTIATALISGGISGNIYNVTNTIVTESGLLLTATFRLNVNAYNG